MAFHRLSLPAAAQLDNTAGNISSLFLVECHRLISHLDHQPLISNNHAVQGRRLSSGLVAAWLALLLVGCRPEGGVFNIPKPGIPLALGEERARRVRDLRYEVSFDIPSEVEERINGRVTVRFFLVDASAPLVFDFAPATADRASDEAFVESVIVSGSEADFQLADGYLVIPVAELDTGENTVEIVFRAGDRVADPEPRVFVHALRSRSCPHGLSFFRPARSQSALLTRADDSSGMAGAGKRR